MHKLLKTTTKATNGVVVRRAASIHPALKDLEEIPRFRVADELKRRRSRLYNDSQE